MQPRAGFHGRDTFQTLSPEHLQIGVEHLFTRLSVRDAARNRAAGAVWANPPQ
jgi:hypothetical protein